MRMATRTATGGTPRPIATPVTGAEVRARRGTARDGRSRRAVLAGAVAAMSLLGGCGYTTAAEGWWDTPDPGTADPVRIDEVLEDAAMLDGRTIRVNGWVADTVAESALVLASGEGAGSVLVVHQPDVDPAEGSDIGVVGVVRPSFDLRAVETEVGADYDEDRFATFADEPYLLATTVEANSG